MKYTLSFSVLLLAGLLSSPAFASHICSQDLYVETVPVYPVPHEHVHPAPCVPEETDLEQRVKGLESSYLTLAESLGERIDAIEKRLTTLETTSRSSQNVVIVEVEEKLGRYERSLKDVLGRLGALEDKVGDKRWAFVDYVETLDKLVVEVEQLRNRAPSIDAAVIDEQTKAVEQVLAALRENKERIGKLEEEQSNRSVVTSGSDATAGWWPYVWPGLIFLGLSSLLVYVVLLLVRAWRSKPAAAETNTNADEGDNQPAKEPDAKPAEPDPVKQPSANAGDLTITAPDAAGKKHTVVFIRAIDHPDGRAQYHSPWTSRIVLDENVQGYANKRMKAEGPPS